MNKVHLAFLINYLLMTGYFFINWLRFCRSHPSYSPEEKFLSNVILFITTVLWPIIVPMSFLKILTTRKVEFNTVIPLIVAVFAFSVALYMG
ncbi:hypothetical protein DP116_04620 [Brasilonema bromeliae SPC951]|uniref:Uncharacterized protein n=1 Tax=Brasilonema bromeliae SPC951 TaxID=385972 RepID=A0ABX1P5F0_9CYAN|nr:hypothetical protein [Brasilonema bromeliae SPC951]